jgi:hypothetical protein
MATLSLPEQITNAVLQHEITNNYGYARTLSLAATGSLSPTI